MRYSNLTLIMLVFRGIQFEKDTQGQATSYTKQFHKTSFEIKQEGPYIKLALRKTELFSYKSEIQAVCRLSICKYFQSECSAYTNKVFRPEM